MRRVDDYDFPQNLSRSPNRSLSFSTHTPLFVARFFSLAMTSSDVVASTLFLPIPLISLGLLAYDWHSTRSAPAKRAIFVLLAILPAVAGGTALSAASGEPLRVVAKAFTNLLYGTLSGVSIYALSSSPQFPAFPPPFLRYFLSLAALLVVCELISALISMSPHLLSAALALVSRVILLMLSIAAAILLRRRYTAMTAELNYRKGTRRVWDDSQSSLALKEQSKRPGSPANKWDAPDLLSPSSTSHTFNASEDVYRTDKQHLILLPLVLVLTQFFAAFSASLNTNQPLQYWLLLQFFLLDRSLCSSEERVAFGCDHGPLRSDLDKVSRDKPPLRTPNPPVSPHESDSLFDFLSLRDPFASSPPPPPPLPPVGLDLDEVDLGWNGSKEISMQYRFPAPRSIVKGGRRKGKKARANGKNLRLLVHQDSARTLLPVPETRGTEMDVERDRGFGDEARLAQLLLQSLIEECRSPTTPTPVPTVQPPQPAHIQQTSRWSASTTVQSIMSASISNRSGVSTYATCASEKVPAKPDLYEHHHFDAR
ncbi:hypothetical protein JVU11DRAFT_2812 [Chiua virens]|nr:hypothetical protein JVU11DRAFT_2812 [Chiua virens]